MSQMNAAIAESIFRWVPIGSGLYQRLGGAEGWGEPCPDFQFGARHQELREAMSSRGFVLTVTPNPVDWEKKTGRTFTARYTRGSGVFEATEADENLAVCLAALRAVGCVPASSA
jgi:hypothetical protein